MIDDHYEPSMTKARRRPEGALGIAIRLEDEHANVLDYFDWPTWLDRVLPPYEDESFQCLRFIDPYGDTVFNRAQIPTLLGELERVTDRTNNATERQQLAEIARLAERCSSEAHLCIRFYGD